MIDLRYPVLLVHGMGFRDRKRFCYWGRIPKALEREGVRVFYGGQDACGSLEDNAAFLAARIEELCRSERIEKFNVIAHSKGGVEMRRVITTLGEAPRVASLTTVSTPHNGSRTMDFFWRFPKWILKAGCALSDLWFRILGDRRPRCYEAIRSFTTGECAAFNQTTPDAPGVFYQSCGFSFKTPRSDMLMFLTHLVVKHFDGENDGLLSPGSAKWTNYMGTFTGVTNRGISHCDEVDMRRRRLTAQKGEGISDIPDFYLEIVRGLANRGY